MYTREYEVDLHYLLWNVKNSIYGIKIYYECNPFIKAMFKNFKYCINLNLLLTYSTISMELFYIKCI